MKVEKLAPSQRVKGRWLCHLEDGSILRLSENEIADFSLYAGRELTEEELTALGHAAKEREARRRALNMLSVRPMSRKELEQKLARKEVAADTAAQTAEHMERLGFLNDREYARQLAAHYSAKGYGPRKIRDELFRRGVPREFWEEALEEAPPPEEAIDAFLRAKLRGKTTPDRGSLKKLSDALARRGFSWSHISAALRRLDAGGDWEEP